MYLFELYIEAMKKKRETVKPFSESSMWPKEWKTTHYKVYERFPLVPLPEPEHVHHRELTEMLSERTSRRAFGNMLSSEMLSQFLYFSVGEKKAREENGEGSKEAKRMYPSAGRLYPLECYVILFEKSGAGEPGVYHYDVATHGLRILRRTVPERKVFVEATAETCVEKAGGILILTGIASRIAPKYAERSAKFMYIEAGAVAQNMGLIAEAMHIDAVQVGTCAEDVVEEILDIDGYNEVFLHAIVFG